MESALWDEPYHYRPLVSPGAQIRLLAFEGPKYGDEIRCSMHIFELESAPPYASISYTWGDDSVFRRVWIDGTCLSVRHNRWYALSQIQQHSETLADFDHYPKVPPTHGRSKSVMNSKIQYFWIDSICIAQSDLHEKTFQVQIMWKIFSKANCVLACVGEHKIDSHLLARALEDIESETRRGFSKFALLRLGSALQLFDRRRYWSRLWTKPETQVAQSLQLFCGEHTFSWHCLSRFRSQLARDHEIRKLRCPDFSTTSIELWHHDNFPVALYRFPLLLQDHIDFLCFDPRDRVYASLFAVDWEDKLSKLKRKTTPLAPDYEKSRLDVFLDVINLFSSENAAMRGDFFQFEDLYRTVHIVMKALQLNSRDYISSDYRVAGLVNIRQRGSSLYKFIASCQKPSGRSEFEDVAWQDGRKVRTTASMGRYSIISKNQDGTLSGLFDRSYTTYPRVEPDNPASSKADGQAAGSNFQTVTSGSDVAAYVCAEAQDGDLLLSPDVENYHGRRLCLVLRKVNGAVHEIVGQGLVEDGFALWDRSCEGSIREGVLYFDGLDLLALAVQDQANAAENLPSCRLITGVCSSRFSSYAEITGLPEEHCFRSPSPIDSTG